MHYETKTVEEYKAMLGKSNYKKNYGGFGTGSFDAMNRIAALEHHDTLCGGYIYTHGILYRLFPSFNELGRKEFTPTDEGTLENIYEWINEYCKPKIVWMSKDAAYYKNIADLIDYSHSTFSGQCGYQGKADLLEELKHLGCPWQQQIDLEDRENLYHDIQDNKNL